MEKKTYRAWAYTAAVAASFAAMPLGTAQAEEAPAETKPQAVIALPDITSVPITVVPAPVVTEEEALKRQEEERRRQEEERKRQEEERRKQEEKRNERAYGLSYNCGG